jgi:protein-L-isoaspartate(D-aspartate) O-methyltransferase
VREAGRDTLLRQLRRFITDQRVLAAIGEVPREEFVPPAIRRMAWRDEALPIGCGQTISQPLVVARMCELLELRGDEHVLDVGTGSGYHAAVLARLSRSVVSIERHAELSAAAAAALGATGVTNVRLVVGDGTQGFAELAPYGAINVAAAARGEVPPALCEQLGDGGRMVLPLADGGERLVVLRRRGGAIERRAHEQVAFVPLVSEAR